ncbi:hypothetical protein [Flavobacterium crassostreae]|uniref:Uncharacterized protein n=1 Tax=Flavobacterium crassostreae TaxID=1763534 RepID=A0A1B9DKI7_9FLAO|nr:hypothetical protein [Flavobacterium crassostreae]OCB70197.1 hypothetical protein LPBF_12185 [Flavobacterium crassostreae]
MENYILILTAPKLNIPESNIIEFILDLIKSNLVKIEHFGYELDNPADYENDDMIATRLGTSYFTFQFELNKLDYDDYTEEETLQLIVDQLQTKQIGNIIIDDKDVDVYIKYDNR